MGAFKHRGLAPFLREEVTLRKKPNKRDYFCLGLLMVVQFSVLLFTSWETGPAWDEWGHLPSGLYTLQYQDYAPYCVNPPLPRLIAAAPVLFAGGEIEYQPLHKNIPGVRHEFSLAYSYVRQHGTDCFFWVSLARTSLLPVCLLGTFLLWSIGNRFGGVRTGFLAALLWAFSPTVLTWGATITGDISGAVFGLFASYRFYIWLRLGSYLDAILLGFAIALAMLSKATWVILPPIVVLISICYCIKNRGQNLKFRSLQILLAFLTAWIVIHACYDFQGVLQPLGSFDFVSDTLGGKSGNRYESSWLASLPVPLPYEYIRGIDIQKNDFESGIYTSYLWGKQETQGWWYYYVVGIWLKEPLALWILMAVGLTLFSIRRRLPSRTRLVSLLIVCFPGIAVLLFVSTQTGFTDHVRYVLPFFPSLFLGVALLFRKAKKTTIFVCCLAIGYVISSLVVVPRSYAYFNESMRGGRPGWQYLQGSNLDWGQDLLALTRWADEFPAQRPIHVLYSIPLFKFGEGGSDEFDFEDGRSFISPAGPLKSGCWAVFTQCMLDERYAWFRTREPDIQISVSVQIYYVTEEEVEEAKSYESKSGR